MKRIEDMTKEMKEDMNGITTTFRFRPNGIKSLLLMLLLLVMGVGESVGVFPRVLVFYRIIGKIGV